MSIVDNVRQPVRLYKHFFAAHPGRSTLMLLALTAAALAEGVGIAALLPLIGLVIDAKGAGGAMTLYVERVFAWFGLDLSLGGLLILIVVAISLKSLLMLLAAAQVGYTAAHVAMNLRLAVIRALLRARWTHFVDRRAGNLASAVAVEPGRTARLLCGLLPRSVRRNTAPGLRRTVRRHIVGNPGSRTRRRRVQHGRIESARHH